MTIGLLQLKLRIPEAQSLKAKRQVLLGFKTRLRSKFNVSVCEADEHDKWQVSTLAAACVAVDRASVDSLLNRMVEASRRQRDLELTDYSIELF